MNILIIGNGFDLAHGLPTKYEDFLKYTNAFKQYKDICKNKIVKPYWDKANEYDKKLIIKFSNMYEDNKTLFQEMDDLISNNIWIDYFWEMRESRKLKGKDGWIDFESEISKIIQTLDESRLMIIEKINEGGDGAKLTPKQERILAPLFKTTIFAKTVFTEEGTKSKKNELLKDLNKLTRCLEIYLVDDVEIIQPEVKLPDIEKLKINRVLSFNYTHTYERLYDLKNVEIKYDYIHGEIKSNCDLEKCNLILGIDEYLEGHAKNRDNEFIQFKKFYQRIFKKTGCGYVDWQEAVAKLPQSYNHDNNVYILGHSLDITDKDILYSLIKMVGTKTTIFYHSQEALGNQISNLVKILGEDELISSVHGAKASIILQKQQDSVAI